jgi:membrane associated rhomboid family serine protease
MINVMIFIATLVAPKGDFNYCFGAGAGFSDYLRHDVITGYLSMWNVRTDCFKPYQLFTYMFVHGDFFHIFFNMLVMASTAPVLENFWGQKRFLTFYLVTGIGAGVFHLLINLFFFENITYGTMLGASGAVYGILMAFGMMFPNMEMRLLIPPVSLKAKYLVWVLGAVTFLLSGAGVAHFAHLGGIVFAFILLRIWRHKNGTYF